MAASLTGCRGPLYTASMGPLGAAELEFLCALLHMELD